MSGITWENIGKACIDIGQYLSSPGEWASETIVRSLFTTLKPGRVDNCDWKIFEVARRGISLANQLCLSPFTVGLMASGKIVMSVGDYLTGKDFYYTAGSKEKKPCGEFSILQMNVAMFFGGLPWNDGLTPAKERIADFLKLVKKKDPDILLLNEVSFGPGKLLTGQLKEQYAHIYKRIGPPKKISKEATGLFVASKFPIEQTFYKQFSDEGGLNRGIFAIETEEAIFITTHFPSGDRPIARSKMLEMVNKKIAKLCQKTAKPIFLAGDLNISDEEEYQDSCLSENFYDFRNNGVRPERINEETATCTNRLKAYARGEEEKLPPEDEYEMDDYFLLAKGGSQVSSLEVEMIPGFEKKRPLSDHRGFLIKVVL